jgi:protein-S-isoprenylcysteine O-methyltransferase Ste14
MGMSTARLGKFCYGFFFCVCLPLLLIGWSRKLNVPFTLGDWTYFGWTAGISGALLMMRGMFNLWIDGKGLPMNAYPPTKFVTKGAYQYFRHPIYVGFCLIAGGASIILGSPTGFYIVTPTISILCWALVFGFEKHDLEKRFMLTDHPVYFGFVKVESSTLSLKERAFAFLSAFLPWGILYSIVIHVGVLPSSFDTTLSFEKSWPVVEWMVVPYSITYLYVMVCPFIVRSRSELNSFLSQAWLATSIGIFLQVVLPLYAEARSFSPKTVLGEWIILERAMDGPAAAFPSFHVIWALIAETVWRTVFPKVSWIIKVVTWLIVISCAGVGAHSIVDTIAGVLVFVIISHRATIISRFNAYCESLANSWNEIRVGRMRIINHSSYAGLAAMAGTILLAVFSVPLSSILMITIASAIGGVLWGQLIEGSPRLLRPFGYYGALIGGFAGIGFVVIGSGQSFIGIAEACAIAAPLVQAIGRLRCLVQGCCHGKATSAAGIRYYNEHSRVCKISGLKGECLHNTQLYSIVSNIAIQLILLRLWYGNASGEMIVGLYLMLSGAFRFVEEAFRGEVQTRLFAGLRFYQWIAILSVVAGMIFTALPGHTHVVFNPYFSFELILTIIVGGIIWAFGMGMDFPSSDIRYSRLSG